MAFLVCVCVGGLFAVLPPQRESQLPHLLHRHGVLPAVLKYCPSLEILETLGNVTKFFLSQSTLVS